MIIKKEKKGSIVVYHLKKIISDKDMESLQNTYVKPSQIKLVIDHDADVYTEDNKLLLKYRKNKLDKKKYPNFMMLLSNSQKVKPVIVDQHPEVPINTLDSIQE